MKFEAGKTYTFSWFYGDGGSSTLEVISRTEKTVEILYSGEKKRKKIYSDERGEYIMPTGSYSCAPVCRAFNVVERETEEQAESTAQEEEKKTMLELKEPEKTQEEKNMKFEGGKTYLYSYATDEDHTRFTVKVVSRTAKSVLILKDGSSKAQWKRICTGSTGEEFFYPEGHFSMCPVCSASHELEDSKQQNIVGKVLDIRDSRKAGDELRQEQTPEEQLKARVKEAYSNAVRKGNFTTVNLIRYFHQFVQSDYPLKSSIKTPALPTSIAHALNVSIRQTQG